MSTRSRLHGSSASASAERIERHQVTLSEVAITDASAQLPRSPTVRITACDGVSPVTLTAAPLIPAGTAGERVRLVNLSGKTLAVPAAGGGLLLDYDLSFQPNAALELEYVGSGWAVMASDTASLQTRPVATTAPSTGDALTWDGSAWAPAAGAAGLLASPKTPALDANHTDSWLMTETSGTTFANQVGGRPALVAAQESDWTPRNCLFITRTNPELTPAATPLRATGLALPSNSGSITIEWFCRYPYGNGAWVATPFVFLTQAGWGAGDANYMGCGSGFYVHSKIGGATKDFSPAAGITDRLSAHHAMLVYTHGGSIAFWLDGVSLSSLACGTMSASLDRLEVGGWSGVYPFDRNSVHISNIRISNVARDAAYAAQVQAALRAG